MLAVSLVRAQLLFLLLLFLLQFLVAVIVDLGLLQQVVLDLLAVDPDAGNAWHGSGHVPSTDNPWVAEHVNRCVAFGFLHHQQAADQVLGT